MKIPRRRKGKESEGVGEPEIKSEPVVTDKRKAKEEKKEKEVRREKGKRGLGQRKENWNRQGRSCLLEMRLWGLEHC